MKMLRHMLIGSFLVALTAATTPVVKCQSAFEIRPVVDSLQHDAIRMVEEGSHEAVYVGATPFFSITDVDSASVYVGSEANGNPLYAVNIQFRPALDDSMRSLTRRLVGRRLAFVVDGRILATPKILDPIQTARVGLFVSSEGEARKLAMKIISAIEKR